MGLYSVSMGYGLYVVRAEDENDARRVAFDGPALDGHADPAERYGMEFDPDAFVVELAPEGPRGLIDFHFG